MGMIDISGAKSKVSIIAVPTFPQGFTIEEFATDSDPVVIDDIEVNNTEVGVNGDVVCYKRATLLNVELSVIPTTESDRNLTILLNSNRLAKNKVATNDDITMIITYADGRIVTFSGGVIISGTVANTISSDSKIRTKTYRFTFSNVI